VTRVLPVSNEGTAIGPTAKSPETERLRLLVRGTTSTGTFTQIDAVGLPCYDYDYDVMTLDFRDSE
jgi:hypothetical protein